MIKALLLLLLLLLCACAPGGVSDEVAGTGTNAGNGKVTATVLYHDGTPASNVSIFIRDESYLCDTIRAGKPRVADYRTNCAGNFYTDSLADGYFLLEINDNFLFSKVVSLSIENGNSYNLEDTIYLNRGSNLKGSIALDDLPTGVPVYIQLRGLEYVQRLRSNGTFYFCNLPPGDHLVNVVSGSSESGIVVDYAAKTKEDQTTSLDEISFPVSLEEDTLYVRQLLDLHGLDSIPVMSVVEIGKGRVARLNLNGYGLHTIPKGFGRLRCRFVYLNQNSFTHIPIGLTVSKALIGLEMEDNQITTLPNQIGAPERLKYLKLSGNDFSGAIDQVVNYVGLRSLDLKRCGISELPSDIGTLHYLEELALEENELTDLPMGLTTITTLSEIGVNGNRLTSLSDELHEWLNSVVNDTLWKESQRP